LNSGLLAVKVPARDAGIVRTCGMTDADYRAGLRSRRRSAAGW
jgi:hypothetical protein